MMKKFLSILLLPLLIAGCKEQKLSHKNSVIEYYKAFDNGDFNILKTTIGDSITLLAGDYTMRYDHDSFYEQQFKWDSIFKSSYNIVELKEDNNTIIATIAQSNLRNAFLKNNPLIFTNRISFNKGKIFKIKELDYKNVDWTTWTQQKNNLVNWIKRNHPNLDGFVEDMSMIGAKNYLKAITLYENRNL